MRGRKPTPTALKIVAGNPGKRPLNKKEPKAPKAEIAAPKHLSKKEAQVWSRFAPQMIESGLLSKLDTEAFIMLCKSMALYEEASKKVLRHGMALIVRGALRRSPYLDIANGAQDRATALMREFGLMPSPRSRMNVTNIAPLANTDSDGEESQNDKRFFGTAG